MKIIPNKIRMYFKYQLRSLHVGIPILCILVCSLHQFLFEVNIGSARGRCLLLTVAERWSATVGCWQPLNIATPHPLSRLSANLHLIITLTDGEHQSILIKSVIKTRLVIVYFRYKSSHMNLQKLILLNLFDCKILPREQLVFPWPRLWSG